MVQLGHFPGNVSGHSILLFPKLLIDRERNLSGQLTPTYYWKLPFVQGRLKLRCKIILQILATVNNHMLVNRNTHQTKKKIFFWILFTPCET